MKKVNYENLKKSENYVATAIQVFKTSWELGKCRRVCDNGLRSASELWCLLQDIKAKAEMSDEDYEKYTLRVNTYHTNMRANYMTLKLDGVLMSPEFCDAYKAATGRDWL